MCPRRSSTSIEIGVFGTRKGDRLKVLFRKWRSKLYLDGPVCSACGKELLAHILPADGQLLVRFSVAFPPPPHWVCVMCMREV